ncbi:hypothetical protein [Nocardioides sp. B-3]|uniref:hypothetical protein n=1 Tax=Nocardioides sp. B-3 TaxID=2895565 RepID=UPI002152EF00|nr:hypothetical protein [Nocardioides sp. B-3]UUZ57672.1 hypothetical protein LP418_14585 [Nocardioides sp. B-3]
MLASLAGALLVASTPLAGTTIVIDPGHQLGNHNFPSRINRLVPAGGFDKPCNTTGTATNGGYPEATFCPGGVGRTAGPSARPGCARRDDADLQPRGPLGTVRRCPRPGGEPHPRRPQGLRAR